MPPLRHLVFFKWTASATQAMIAEARQALLGLPAVIPNILYYNVFHAIDRSRLPAGYAMNNQGYTMVIDSVFQSSDALSVYAPHHAHQHVIKTFLNPIREENLVIDYALPQSFNIDAFLQLQRAPHVRHLVLLKPTSDSDSACVSSALNKWEALPTVIPEIVSIHTGQQDTSQLYSGYTDRSKGYTVCGDLTINDRPGLVAYHDHPAHVEAAKDLIAVTGGMESVLVFDYEA